MNLNDKQLEVNLQAFLKSISNNNRIKILKHIHEKNKVTATEIVNTFYLEQATVARHLTMLRKNGVISREMTKPRTFKAKRGREVYYTLNLNFIESVFEGFIDYIQRGSGSNKDDIRRQFLDHKIKISHP